MNYQTPALCVNDYMFVHHVKIHGSQKYIKQTHCAVGQIKVSFSQYSWIRLNTSTTQLHTCSFVTICSTVVMRLHSENQSQRYLPKYPKSHQAEQHVFLSVTLHHHIGEDIIIIMISLEETAHLERLYSYNNVFACVWLCIHDHLTYFWVKV